MTSQRLALAARITITRKKTARTGIKIGRFFILP